MAGVYGSGLYGDGLYGSDIGVWSPPTRQAPPPKVKQIVVAALLASAAVTDIVEDRVGTRMLKDGRPCIVVRRSGGTIPFAPLIHSPVVQIDCWSHDDIEAEDLADRAYEALIPLWGAWPGGGVYKVEPVGSFVDDEDEETGAFRVLFQVAVSAHGLVPAADPVEAELASLGAGTLGSGTLGDPFA